MSRRDWIVALLAAVVIVAALWVLEGARRGVEITTALVGATPVTTYAKSGVDGPAVVVAHGFAGSRQMMQAYALSLAQAGYRVHSFDFLGHGRHSVPMSGDVGSVDGTTRLLVEQTLAVIHHAGGEGAKFPTVALLGHSMATDVLVRVAAQTPGDEPLVLLSAFSREITADRPDHLLLVTGAWEPGLVGFATEALQMLDPDAQPGRTVSAKGLTRRAVLAPAVEHVAILQSRTGRAEAVAWLDRFYSRSSAPSVPPTGWALLALLAGIVALARPLARLLPDRRVARAQIPPRSFALATLAPAVAAPLIAVPLDPGVLPVLVADYLALHLALFGGLQLVILWRAGVPLGHVAPAASLALLVYGLGIFGLALDRYGANFWPTPERLAIIAALSLGAVPFMLSDALVTQGGRAPLWQRLSARAAFLVSIAIAVALDFEGLFFLLMIAPVIVLFYLVFGLMGRAVALRTGAATAGLALGLILAWALGVSFPLFSA